MPQASLATRERQLAELITDADVEDALAALRRGMKAEQSLRVPAVTPAQKLEAATRKGGYAYALVPDFTTQIAAAKALLEFKFGRAPQSVTLKPGAAQIPDGFDRDAAIRALQDMGGDLGAIAATYINGLKAAEPVSSTESSPPKEAEKPKAPQMTETPSALDVLLLDA